MSTAISDNNFSNLKMHKIGHVLIPKKSLSDYRNCALIEVYDEIVYLTLVLLVSSEVEKMRLNKSDSRIYSYRLSIQENGHIFDSAYNYTSFREQVQRKSNMNKNKIIIETDISNYYDRLNIHRIESILRSNPKIDEDIISLVNELLLYWANRDSYGLPVGSNASRILAEAALVEVDNYLISKNVDFCRFVDDYRIFARDAFTAHSHLAHLTLCLNREGVFLNAQKTRIKDISSRSAMTVRNVFDEKEVKEAKADQFNSEIGKIIRGYSGLIPTKFRELSASQRKKLRENDLKDMMQRTEDSLLVEPQEITELIKTIAAFDEFEQLARIPNVLKKFPQFIPYFVDVILKKGASISASLLEKIQEDFSIWFDDGDTPEYIQVYLVRLYTAPLLYNKRILLDAFRNLKRNSGDYIGRALLESLGEKLTRGELLEVRKYYDRADKWEGRQIIKLVDQGFSHGEKRPFFKDIEIHTDDLFVKQLIKTKKKEARRHR